MNENTITTGTEAAVKATEEVAKTAGNLSPEDVEMLAEVGGKSLKVLYYAAGIAGVAVGSYAAYKVIKKIKAKKEAKKTASEDKKGDAEKK